ncbi:MAG: hypothetical protein MPJ50_10040 [Pirellulales bacterium]|nr:hypothetical protein [Pirellulales bacterium]
MIRAVLSTMALVVIGLPGAAVAQDVQRSDAAKDLQRLRDECNEAMREFMNQYQAAENDEQRSTLLQESYPVPKFGARFLEFAKKHPRTAEALTALHRAMQSALDEESQDEIIKIIVRDYLKSEALGEIVPAWTYDPSKADLLHKIIEVTPYHSVKGIATYTLAKSAMRIADSDKDAQAEAVAQFEEIALKYGDVSFRNRTLKEVAEADVFEATRLQIGMEAPDIEGTDVDDIAFKLFDYRGKVVVLDFWGDW